MPTPRLSDYFFSMFRKQDAWCLGAKESQGIYQTEVC